MVQLPDSMSDTVRGGEGASGSNYTALVDDGEEGGGGAAGGGGTGAVREGGHNVLAAAMAQSSDKVESIVAEFHRDLSAEVRERGVERVPNERVPNGC